MSKKAKRIAIAKDVIKSLKARKIMATEGSYLRTARIDPKESGKQLCEIMKDRVCEVCAKGALFVSAVAKYDNFIFDDAPNALSTETWTQLGHAPIEERLSEDFTDDQLDLIEFAFECGFCVDGDGVKGNKKHTKLEYLRAAQAFGIKYPMPEDRMAAIMKNIIANEGTFVVKPKKSDEPLTTRLERVYERENPFYSDEERLANS